MPSFLLYNLANTIALVFLLTSLIQSLLATYFSTKLTNLSVSSRSLRAGNISYSSFYSQPQNLAPYMAYFSSVQFSCSVMSNSLQSHEPQYAKPPCPSPTPRVHPNPCPSSQWCHPTISSSVVPFSSCLQSFPASGSFQMSQLSTSGGQSIRVSVSTSVFPMNTQDWSLGWTPCRPRDSQEPFPTPQFKSINSSALGFLYSSTLTSIHDHWKNHSLD